MSNIEAVCLYCGCTEDVPCVFGSGLVGEACSWVAPGLCSNPRCVEQAYHAITLEQILDLVERLEAA